MTDWRNHRMNPLTWIHPYMWLPILCVFIVALMGSSGLLSHDVANKLAWGCFGWTGLAALCAIRQYKK